MQPKPNTNGMDTATPQRRGIGACRGPTVKFPHREISRRARSKHLSLDSSWPAGISVLRMRTAWAGFIEPCLPSPAPNPPAGDGWIHEIKLDGFRLLARRDGAGVRLLTRRGIDS